MGVGMRVARIVIVFARIRRCRLRKSFCHVRLFNPGTDVMYLVQEPTSSHRLSSPTGISSHLLALQSSALPKLTCVDMRLKKLGLPHASLPTAPSPP
jgi:hypothetical protein